MLERPLFRIPLHDFVRSEYPVPDIYGDAEIVPPHVVLVVQVMDRPFEPEA